MSGMWKRAWVVVASLGCSACVGTAPTETTDAAVDVTPRFDAGLVDAGREVVDASADASRADAYGGSLYDASTAIVDASSPAPECDPRVTYPATESRPITVGGQAAWAHDEGVPYGIFHTFDALVACSGDTPRRVHVLLPRDYETSGLRHPVLYASDGQTAFWSGDSLSGVSWDMQGALSELARCHAIERPIVVAIRPLDRDREYTHEAAYPGRACCGIDAYTRYVADCLRPFVDTHYRTHTGPAHTAIVGSSHGGLAAFWIATARPDVFGAAASLSPSFWVGLDSIGVVGGPLDSSPLLDHARPTLSARDARPRLYVDWGLVRTGGFHNTFIEDGATRRGREMEALLRATYGYTDVELRTVADPIGAHDEASWARRFPDVVRWLFPRE